MDQAFGTLNFEANVWHNDLQFLSSGEPLCYHSQILDLLGKSLHQRTEWKTLLKYVMDLDEYTCRSRQLVIENPEDVENRDRRLWSEFAIFNCGGIPFDVRNCVYFFVLKLILRLAAMGFFHLLIILLRHTDLVLKRYFSQEVL